MMSIGRIILKICSIDHVPPVDSNGKCDPYLKFDVEGRKGETSVKKATLAPTWDDEEIVLGISSPYSEIHCELWDYNRVKDTLLASTSIPIRCTEYYKQMEYTMINQILSKVDEDEDEEFITLTLKMRFESDVKNATTPEQAFYARSLENALQDSNSGSDSTPFSLSKSNAAGQRLSVCSTVVFSVIYSIQALLSWQNPSNTVIMWIISLIVVFYPVLVLFVMPIAAIYYANYRESNKTPLLKSTSSVSMKHKMDNMRSIQNMTTDFCNMNDILYDLDSKLFGSAVFRSKVKTYLLIGTIILIIPLYYLPVSWILAVLASTVFLSGSSRVTRWLNNQIPPVLGVMNKVRGVKNKQREETDELVIVECWENQRWWLGVGWTTTMLPGDHSVWSDEVGDEKTKLDCESELPFGWEFQTDWEEDAWRYGGKKFSSTFTTEKTSGAYVRRRRWTRRMAKK